MKGAGELRPRHSRAHHDQVLGEFVELVALLPRQDAFPVGGSFGKHAGSRSGGEENRVRGDVPRCIVVGHLDGGLRRQRAPTVDDLDPCLFEVLTNAGTLRVGEFEDSLVDGGEVDAERRPVGGPTVDANPEVARRGRLIDRLRRCDQCLAGDAIGQDGRATDLAGADERDVCAELTSDQRPSYPPGPSPMMTTRDDWDTPPFSRGPSQRPPGCLL